MSAPAIVVVSQYVTAKKANSLELNFHDFVEYVNRDSSKIQKRIKDSLNTSELYIQKDFYKYMDYMNDSKKQGELFTANKDYLDKEELSKLKEAFALAQKNESPMWQDVISFDNAWLEKQGLYRFKNRKIR